MQAWKKKTPIKVPREKTNIFIHVYIIFINAVFTARLYIMVTLKIIVLFVH